jgi:hypothetical protein
MSAPLEGDCGQIVRERNVAGLPQKDAPPEGDCDTAKPAM